MSRGNGNHMFQKFAFIYFVKWDYQEITKIY